MIFILIIGIIFSIGISLSSLFISEVLVYESVEEYFNAEWPQQARMLHNTGAYWYRVKENTVPNAELEHDIKDGLRSDRTDSNIFLASVALMIGRMNEKIPNPK